MSVGKTKRYLEGHDIRDAEADRQKLADHMLGVRAIVASQSQMGARSYNSQTNGLQEYTRFDCMWVGIKSSRGN